MHSQQSLYCRHVDTSGMSARGNEPSWHTLGPYRRFPKGKSFPLRKRRGEGHVARGRSRGNARVRRWHRVTSPEGTAWQTRPARVLPGSRPTAMVATNERDRGRAQRTLLD